MGIVLFIGIFLEIWLVNRLSTYGQKIFQLERSSISLKMENQILINQIDKKASLAEIEKEAINLGFEKKISVEYLKVTTDVALNPTVN